MANFISIDSDWLLERATEENAKVQSKRVSSFAAFFISKGKKKLNLDEVQKTLGKIEMIHEIMKKASSELQNQQSTKP